MSLLENLAEKATERAVDKTFDSIDKKEELKEQERTKNDSLGKKVARGAGNFFLGLLMAVIALGINFIMFFGAFIDPFDDEIFWIFGATSVLYAIICFAVPALRRISYVRWLAYLAIVDAIWAFKIAITGPF